jgi:type IV secretory pathway VirB2 component (pilin)
MAFGDTARSASQKGAFHTVASQPFGEVLLWIIAVGLFGYALWQLIAAFNVHEQEESKAWGKRALYIVKTVIYLALAWTAGSIAANAGSSGGTSMTADIMKSDIGRLLIGAVGVAIVVAGLVMAWKGWTTDFEKKLKREEMSPTTYRVIRTLGKVGYLARGVVFTLFGILVVYAAVTFAPQKASGVDEALQEIAQAPAGPILLTLVALGLIAFGLYSCTEARYRRFEA